MKHHVRSRRRSHVHRRLVNVRAGRETCFQSASVSVYYTTSCCRPASPDSPLCSVSSSSSSSSRPEPRGAPAAVEGRDRRRRRPRHGGQRHQTQQQRHRRRWRWLGPQHQQHFFNYLLLQPAQSLAAHHSPLHRQRTVARPQPQTREGTGTGTGAREVRVKYRRRR